MAHFPGLCNNTHYCRSGEPACHHGRVPGIPCSFLRRARDSPDMDTAEATGPYRRRGHASLPHNLATPQTCNRHAPTLSRYTCCSASMKQISPSPSSKHSPQINRASGFAHEFCPQSGQVNFVLLDFFALSCSLAGTDCQWSWKPCAASFAYACA